jgi:hypothetical protein
VSIADLAADDPTGDRTPDEARIGRSTPDPVHHVYRVANEALALPVQPSVGSSVAQRRTERNRLARNSSADDVPDDESRVVSTAQTTTAASAPAPPSKVTSSPARECRICAGGDAIP